MTFQNGNLFTLFLDKGADLSFITRQKIDKYKDTQMYKSFNSKIDKGDKHNYLKQIIYSLKILSYF